MARTKTKKEVGVTSGSHLVVTHNHDGTVDMKWDWDKLLEDVQAACATISTDIIEATETKLKKTRKAKTV